ncbi:mannose-6-phosphate isomerase [Niveispirillum lacus]|uniref:Mannose-6-phosphate isomerase n=2 Tax=Niveispirillum lacus TaxID=1981099 RepID=A0A255Z457_9PROT|nr:mannose-6-phosphate isomerase [Niveispirillum lacus]
MADIVQRRDRLIAWVRHHAYPLWWEQGYDHARGGFHEKLDQTGRPVDAPRRARVQPRQIYSYALAPTLGWTGPARAIVEQALATYLSRYRRDDGLFRTLVAADGSALDDSVDLYDQAFALFGLCHAAQALGELSALQPVAVSLRDRLMARCAHQGGFANLDPGASTLQSNPNMHLFEASLAWEAAGGDAGWATMADGIAGLALTRFIDARTGALREFFDRTWQPAPGLPGRVVEPGHQFEWAWLLLRWGQLRGRDDAIKAGLRLLTIAETHGVDPARGVGFNSLLDDFSIHDHNARLWPQTERIKAAVLAAEITGDPGFWTVATQGADGLLRYLDTPVQGLWWDKLSPAGIFTDEPAPASSFYHITCAIAELDRAVTTALAA